MANNDLVLLDKVLTERQAERAAPLKEDDAFEIFACEQILRGRDLSLDEVEAGVVAGGNDGAIDGVYVFLGDVLLAEDSEVFDAGFAVNKITPGTPLSLILVQAKRTESFTETAVDLVANSTSRLLDLSVSEADLRTLYSEALVDRIGLFRAALQQAATRHPSISVSFHYVTRGNTANVHPKVVAKAVDLEAQFRRLFHDATALVEFVGAAELWKRVSTVPSYTLELTYRENATSGSSHVALVSIRDYLAFLTDDTGALRRHIFDWNVRDYQGEVEVNREIQSSLANQDSPDFWWLNNGVTVICSRTSIVGKTYVLDDVQIVNGLQTSYSIFRTLSAESDEHPALENSVLVRILVTDDPTTRDLVIRATNRQTSVPVASLRATDEIQRNIEAYFLAHGWFYDRRKNYYQNIGKSPERIVSIPLLAQATMAMGLSQAHDSRARPSSLLKKDEDYGKMFSKQIPLDIYVWLATAQKEVDAYLISPSATTSAPERTNLRFHLSMLAAARLHGGRVYAPAQLSSLAQNDRKISDADLPNCLSDLRRWYSDYMAASGDSMDKAAKGSEFVDYLLGSAFP